MAFHRLDENDMRALESIVSPERISAGESNLHLHSMDQTHHKGYLPEAVLWPGSTDEVSAILRLANQRRIPVTPWGAGTSLEGNCCPVAGGIVLDFQEMSRILAIRAEDFQVDVEPGVTYKDMNRTLARSGLFFPPDPGANATIGGMIANNASGIRTIKYGATRDNVLRLTAVLADGRIIRAGSRSPKSSSGYDLARLIIGSEGTLAVVTEATLRLRGIPEGFSAAVATFDSVRRAAEAVYGIMAYGLTPSALEILDDRALRYINREREDPLPEKTTLLIEFTGNNEAGLAEDLGRAREVCEENGCESFRQGVGRDERNRLWETRHRFGECFIRSHPGLDVLIMDAAVPLSRFPDLVERAVDIADEHGLESCVSAHAGDGNLHLNVAGDMSDPAFFHSLTRAYDEIVTFAVSLGGTATGEHGIGIGKRKFMQLEHGEGMEVMRGIKRHLDPNGILNPGKVLPEEVEGSGDIP
ncbi:MAG: FAD-binding oxidoreductase [Deltaproteobacteria bacterium]|nr:FAD-binding oxidoreductase [Deltaproteobacteria bacterium]